jgi:hypothetical protein
MFPDYTVSMISVLNDPKITAFFATLAAFGGKIMCVCVWKLKIRKTLLFILKLVLS